MMKMVVLSVLLSTLMYPSLPQAAEVLERAKTPLQETYQGPTPELPKIDGWTIEGKSKIEVMVTDFAILYLGMEIEYSNPADTNEFVMVTKRYVPFIVAKVQSEDDRNFNQAVIGFYTQRDLNNILKKINDESDAIIYQRWRVAKDPSTGQSVQSGKTEIWFLDSMGVWRFEVGQEVSVGSVSELKTADFKNGILAGVEYSIGSFYQILKIDHGYLVLALKEAK